MHIDANKKFTQVQNMTDYETLTKEGPVAYFKIIQNSAQLQ